MGLRDGSCAQRGLTLATSAPPQCQLELDADTVEMTVKTFSLENSFSRQFMRTRQPPPFLLTPS